MSKFQNPPLFVATSSVKFVYRVQYCVLKVFNDRDLSRMQNHNRWIKHLRK